MFAEGVVVPDGRTGTFAVRIEVAGLRGGANAGKRPDLIGFTHDQRPLHEGVGSNSGTWPEFDPSFKDAVGTDLDVFSHFDSVIDDGGGVDSRHGGANAPGGVLWNCPENRTWTNTNPDTVPRWSPKCSP